MPKRVCVHLKKIWSMHTHYTFRHIILFRKNWWIFRFCGKLSSVLISGHTQHVLDIRARFRRLHTYVLEHIFYSWNALRTAHLVRDCTRFGKRDAIPNEVMCMRAKALKAQTTSASRTSVSPKYTVRSGWMINSDICMYNTRKHTLTHTHTHTPASERL